MLELLDKKFKELGINNSALSLKEPNYKKIKEFVIETNKKIILNS